MADISKMKWRKPIVLLPLSAVFVVYAAMTGGLVVNDVDDFNGQRDIALVAGLDADVWLSPEQRDFGIPYLFYYHGAGKPFGLRLQIWDTAKQYQAIEIEEILIEYTDGEVVRKTAPWTRSLSSHTAYHSSSSGVTQTEMWMLSDQISNLITKHMNVKITLSGRLLKADGQRVTFRVSETFEAESSQRVLTFWQEAAGC